MKTSDLPKSSFYEWERKLQMVNNEEVSLIEKIKDIVEESENRYGYRRVRLILLNSGILVNHKRVLRLMRANGLLCMKFTRRARKYSSYKGEVGKISDNHLNRSFKVKEPNKVWVTDVTEFKVDKGDQKLYMSPIMDLFNSEIISYNLSTSPTVKFTTDPLDEALKVLPKDHSLLVHSDQGFHYQNTQWIKRLNNKGVKQSMSRKGNCIDNSPMENFFGILKQEMYYGEEFKTIKDLENKIKKYIHWYNNKRIKAKLKGLSPVQYRREAVKLNY